MIGRSSGSTGSPVGLLKVEGYWDGLERMLAHAVREGFVRADYAPCCSSARARPSCSTGSRRGAPGTPGSTHARPDVRRVRVRAELR